MKRGENMSVCLYENVSNIIGDDILCTPYALCPKHYLVIEIGKKKITIKENDTYWYSI